MTSRFLRRALRSLLWPSAVLALSFAGCGDDPVPEAPRAAPALYDFDGKATRPLAPLASPPNLIVIMIDTLRADAVGIPGSTDLGSMPFVTSLAKRGVLFTDCTAPAPWTLPSVASFLCGLSPSEHGCNHPNRPVLAKQITTFAEVLRNAYGYETAAMVAGPWLDARGEILQGFASGERRFALRGGEAVISEWDAKRDRAKPFCLFLHTLEAHDPYGERNHAPARTDMSRGREATVTDLGPLEDWQVARAFLLDWSLRSRLGAAMGERLFDVVVKYLYHGYRNDPRPELAAELRDAYFGGVRWVDGLLERVVAHLEKSGLLENTVLAITADHGEAFGEHGILEHGRDLHDELVRIPLVLLGPGPFTGGRVVQGGVGLVDLFPTYFDLVGAAPLPGIYGSSFLPLLRGKANGRVVLSETELTPGNTRLNLDRVLVSARSQRWKYIVAYDRQEGTVVETAYDLSADPRELTDLTAGTGRVDGLPFDEELCPSVEGIRRLLRSAIDAHQRQQAGGYSGGNPNLRWDPPPCGSAPPR